MSLVAFQREPRAGVAELDRALGSRELSRGSWQDLSWQLELLPAREDRGHRLYRFEKGAFIGRLGAIRSRFVRLGGVLAFEMGLKEARKGGGLLASGGRTSLPSRKHRVALRALGSSA